MITNPKSIKSYTKQDQLKRNAPIKEKPFKSKKYLSWFHKQKFGCLVCGLQGIEAHHVHRGASGRPDNSIVPLCHYHHRSTSFSAHGTDANKFNEQYPKEMLLEIATKIFKRWQHEAK